jgi:hypothetical protein
MAIKINNTTVIDDSRNINNVGIVTATKLVGDGGQLSGVGVGSQSSLNTTGIITASKIVANEFEGIGDKLIFSPTITVFSPIDGATGVNAFSSPNILITYDRLIGLGTSGTITLRKNSATGDIVESFVVGVSNRVTISNQTVTIDPTNNFDYNQEYYVVIPKGAIVNGIGGHPSGILSTYNFTTEVGPTLSSASPSSGSTGVDVNSNIVFTFDKNIRPGTGTITLRVGSSGGTIIESYDVASSPRLTFSSNTLTIDPSSTLVANTNYYVVIPNGAIAGYTGTSTYNFTSINPTLGSSFEGGRVICKSSGTIWIAALSSSQVTRTWDQQNDSNIRAQQVSGCTGWFVPTVSQLQNPGFTCRVYWDSYTGTRYWSSSPGPSGGCGVYMSSGGTFTLGTSFSTFIRSFRCVTY